MKKLNILDCTFRDGGYYNNWNFKKKLIVKYLSIISKTRLNLSKLVFLQ